MTYQIGIDSDRYRLTVVTLKDGEYLSSYQHDIYEETLKQTTGKWNRNTHLVKLVERFLDYVERLPTTSPMLTIESAEYVTNSRELVERSQIVGAILSLPYTVHEVSKVTWMQMLTGKDGATSEDVKECARGLFDGAEDEFGGDQNRYDAYCLAKFGHLKNQ